MPISISNAKSFWLFVFPFIIFLLLSIFSASCQRAPKGAIAGVEPVGNVYLFENHSESFPIWKEHRAEKRILVHFDGHIDFDWIPEAFIQEIVSCKTADDVRKRIVHPYEMKAGYEGKVSIWNFIYAAARSGIVREFYWVVPDGTFDRKNLLEDLRSFLAIKMHGVTPSEVGALKFHENRISGALLGVPITIMEMNALAGFQEAVLLDIDVDYFSTGSAIDQEVLLKPSLHPDDFMKRLAQKRLRTDLVTISCSTVGGFLPVPYHYFGEMIKERMKNPETAKGEIAMAEGIATEDTTVKDMAAEDLTAGDMAAENVAREEEEFKKKDQDDPVHRDALLHEADAMRGAGQLYEAIDLYKRFIAENPGSSYIVYARRRLATALADAGQSSIALEELRSFVSQYPDDADARYYLARMHRENGNLREAVPELREAVALDRFNGIYAAELGSCLLGLGEEAEALKWLQRALELKPCNGNAHLNLAFYYSNRGELGKTAEELKSAIFVRPYDANAHFMLGQIYYQKKRFSEAREEWQKALQIAPDHLPARQALSSLH